MRANHYAPHLVVEIYPITKLVTLVVIVYLFVYKSSNSSYLIFFRMIASYNPPLLVLEIWPTKKLGVLVTIVQTWFCFPTNKVYKSIFLCDYRYFIQNLSSVLCTS